jgi:arylalkylamine N-acetyltransferase
MDSCIELENYTTKCIPENCSFKAVNDCGAIVGVFINGFLKRPVRLKKNCSKICNLYLFVNFFFKDPKEVPESYAEKCQNRKFKKVLSLMEYIDSQFNIFDICPDVDTVLDGKIMSVSEKYRGYGIAGKLTDRTMEYMREKGISVMHVLCSSNYSGKFKICFWYYKKKNCTFNLQQEYWKS